MVEYEPLLSLNFFPLSGILYCPMNVAFSTQVPSFLVNYRDKSRLVFPEFEWEIAFLKQMLQDSPEDPCPSLTITLNNASFSTYLPVPFSRENSQSTGSAGLEVTSEPFFCTRSTFSEGTALALCVPGQAPQWTPSHDAAWDVLGHSHHQHLSFAAYKCTMISSQHLDTGNLGFIYFLNH